MCANFEKFIVFISYLAKCCISTESPESPLQFNIQQFVYCSLKFSHKVFCTTHIFYLKHHFLHLISKLIMSFKQTIRKSFWDSLCARGEDDVRLQWRGKTGYFTTYQPQGAIIHQSKQTVYVQSMCTEGQKQK